MDDHKDIIVYVMSRYIHGDRADYVLDFRLMEDYGLYEEAFGQQTAERFTLNEEAPTLPMMPTFISFRNVPARHNGYHFREDSYYRLNIKTLLEAEFILPEEENLFIGYYDFSSLALIDDENLPLLQKTRPLDSADLKVYPSQNAPVIFPQPSSNTITIRVRDIGQGNWNEVLFGEEYRLVYDMGTNMGASLPTLQKLAMARYPDYKAYKPLLLLSHWDVDHFNCLIGLTVQQIRDCFCGACCMNKIRSLKATQVYNSLQLAFGPNLYCYDPCDKKVTDSQRRNPINNNSFFYIGRQSSSTNYSGLSLVIRKSTGSAILTGDIKLAQAFDIYKLERIFGLNTLNHMLVAPHHGGRYPSGRKDYADPTSRVAISVGRNNSYGHPESRMLQLYNARSYGHVHRTDLHGDCDFKF